MAKQPTEDVNKANGNAKELLHSQKLAKIEDLEREFNVKVNVSELTLGDISTLTDDDTPFKERLELIQSLLIEGNASTIKLVQMQRFMQIIELKIDVESNPT